MNRVIFRKEALDRIASLDQLDQAMTVIKPSNIFALIAIAVIVLAGVIWGFTGSIPDTVDGNGVLMNIDNLVSVKNANQGVVKNIFVTYGEFVRAGQVIARIEKQDLLDQIKMNEKKLEGYLRMKEFILSANKNGNSKQAVWKDLYDRGLITEQEYINSRQTEINIDQQLNDTRQQLVVLNENYESQTQLVATATGYIKEVPVRRGDYVQPGSTIAVIDSGGEYATLGALVYFPAQSGKKIRSGMKINIIPTTVKQEEYGFIQGIVTNVSDFPVSDAYLLSSLQNTTLASTFHQINNPIEVQVSLVPDPSTYSGYKWSSSKGPNQKIGSGFICSAKVTTERKHPISYLIPLIKKKFLGIGDPSSTVPQPGQGAAQPAR